MSVEFVDNSKAYTDAIVGGCNDGLTAMASMYADAFRQNIGSEGGRAIATSRKRKGGGRRYKAIAAGESIGKREGRRLFEAAPVGKFPGNPVDQLI